MQSQRRTLSAIVVLLLGVAPAAAQTSWTLDDLLARARVQAAEIVAARLAVAEAEGRLAGASLRFQSNPEIDVNPGYRDSGARGTTEFQLGVAQAFEPAGRRLARLAGAGAAVDRSRASVAAATQQVLAEVSDLFFQAVYARERVTLLTGAVDLTRAIADLAERRYRTGDAAVLDTLVARTALARARADLDAGIAARTGVLGALAALLRIETAFAVGGDLNPAPPPAADALQAAAADRPAFRVLEAAIREAEADSRLALTYRRPEYGVGLRYQREGSDDIVLGGLRITWPLFDAGQELTATSRAKAIRLRAELDSLRSRVRLELQAALAAYDRRAAVVRALDADAVTGIEEAAALTTRSFDVGQIGLADVLIIRRELLDTRMQALAARLELARARVAVDAAAGVLR